MHEAFLKQDEKEDNFNRKNERSLSEVLSEVLKKKDYDKALDIIFYLDENEKITTKEAEKICKKAAATVRRYLKMLVETGYVAAQGNTNNSKYVVNRNKE